MLVFHDAIPFDKWFWFTFVLFHLFSFLSISIFMLLVFWVAVLSPKMAINLWVVCTNVSESRVRLDCRKFPMLLSFKYLVPKEHYWGGYLVNIGKYKIVLDTHHLRIEYTWHKGSIWLEYDHSVHTWDSLLWTNFTGCKVNRWDEATDK